jgi:hypothetical protein
MEIKAKPKSDSAEASARELASKAVAQTHDAIVTIAKASAEAMKARADADIAAAGNFGARWQDAFQVDVAEDRYSVSVTASMTGGPPVSYWKVFQHGATIMAHNPTGLLTWPNTSAFSIGGKVPLFISKAQVTIPKKFHLIEIIEQVAKESAAAVKAILRAKA